MPQVSAHAFAGAEAQTRMLNRMETAKLALRPFEESDAETAFAWFGDPVTMRYVPNGPDSQLPDTQRRIAAYRQHQATHGFSKWVVIERESETPIGDAGLIVLEREGWVDLGFRLMPTRWGHGLATEAASAWIRAAFEQLGIPALGAFTHPDNGAAIRVLEKLHFRKIRVDTVMGMTAIVFELTAGLFPVSRKGAHEDERKCPIRHQELG